MSTTVASLESRLDANTAAHDAKIAASSQKLGGLGQSATKSKEQIVGAFAGMDSGASRLATTFSGLVPGIGAVGLAVGAAVGFFAAAAKAAMDEEVGINRLNQSLQNNIPAWDGNTQAIERQIDARQRFAFSDGELRDSMAALVTRTHDVAAAFDIQSIAMDFARGRGIDLQTATQVLGKVYDGNVGILARYGVAVKDGATATEALGAVQAAYSGQAEKYGQSTAGSVERLKIAFDNAMETVGNAVLPLVTQLANLFTDLIPKIMGVVTTITDALKPAFELIGTILNVIGTGIDWLGQKLGLWKDNTEEASSAVSQSFSNMSSNVGGTLTGLEGRFNDHVTAVTGAGQAAGEGYGYSVTDGIDSYMGDIDRSVTDVYNTLDIQDDAGSLGQAVGGIYASGAPGGVAPGVNSQLGNVSIAAGNVVAAMDKRAEAGQMGTAVGSAFSYAAAVAADAGLRELSRQVNQQVTQIQSSMPVGAGGQPTSGSGGTVGINLGGFRPPTNIGINFGGALSGIAQVAAAAGGYKPNKGWTYQGNPDEGMYSPLVGGLPGGGYGVNQYAADDGSLWPTAELRDQFNRSIQFQQEQKDKVTRATKGKTGGGGGGGGAPKTKKGASGSTGRSEVVSAIKAQVDQTKQISDAIKAAYTSLGELGNFKLPSGFDSGVEELAQGVDRVMMRFQQIAVKFSGDGLKHLSEFNSAAKSGMDLVKSGVDALGKLKDFQAPAEGNVNAFVDSVAYVTGKLGDVAKKWSVDSLAMLGLFSDSTSSSMEMVSKAVDALGKLKDFKKPSDDAMSSFVDAVDYLTDKFRGVTAKWDQASLEQAAKFGESTGKFMDGVGKSFDLLTKLVEFRKPGDVAMSSFADAVDYLSDKFRRVTVKWNDESLKSAAAYGEGTGKLLSGLGSSTDLLGKLVEFKKPSDDAMTAFVEAVDFISDKFRRVSIKWNKDNADSAAIFGEGVGKLLKGVGDATDSLKHIGDFTKPSDDAMRSFADGLDYQSDILRKSIAKWDKDSLEIAAFYGESMGKLMVGLGQAVDPLLHMDGFKRVSKDSIDAFYGTLSDVIDGFGRGAAEFKAKIGPTGADVAKSIGDATEGLGRAIDPLLKLADFKRPGKEQIQAFFGGLADFLTEFDKEAAGFQEHAGVVAADVAVRVGTVAENIGKAFDPLLKVADVQTVTKEQIEGAMSNVWELLNQTDIVMKGMPADFSAKAKDFGSSIGIIFGAIKTGFEVAGSIGGDTGGSIGQGFDQATSSAQVLIAYIDGDARTTITTFTSDTRTMRNTWVTGMSDMALAAEDFARRTKTAFDSIPGTPGTPPGTPPTTPPPYTPPIGQDSLRNTVPLAPISRQAVTANGGTTINNPVYIGGLRADATPEEHALLVSLGRHKRRREHGMSVGGDSS